MSDFQAAAGAQGRAFEDAVARNLEMSGWRIQSRHWREPVTLVEVDLVAIDPTGCTWWVECKGSWLSASGRNGTTRTDTAKKAIASAALLSTVFRACPRLLVTSHVPESGTSAYRWLELAKVQRWITRVEIVSTFAMSTPRPSKPPARSSLFDRDQMGGVA